MVNAEVMPNARGTNALLTGWNRPVPVVQSCPQAEAKVAAPAVTVGGTATLLETTPAQMLTTQGTVLGAGSTNHRKAVNG
jgi:hypothetical protein